MNEITFPTKWMRRLLNNAKKLGVRELLLSSSAGGKMMVVEWSHDGTKYREIRCGCSGLLEETQVDVSHFIESLGPPATSPDSCTIVRKKALNASVEFSDLVEVRCHGVDQLAIVDITVERIAMNVTTKKTVELEVWRDVLTYCGPVMSRDETRLHLACIAFDSTGRASATDGHRLHMVKGTPTFAGIGRGKRTTTRFASLGAGAVGLLSSILKDTLAVEMFVDSDLVFFVTTNTGTVTVEQRDTKAVFPPVDQVIPGRDEHTLLVSCNPHELRDAALTMAKALKQGKSTDGAALCAGEERVTLGLVAKGMPGASITIIGHAECSLVRGVDPEYLAAALLGIDDAKLAIQVGRALDPVLIQIGRKTAVVMPKKIEQVFDGIAEVAQHFGKTIEQVFTAPWTGHQEEATEQPAVTVAPVAETPPADGGLVEVLPFTDPLRAAIDELMKQVAARIESQDGPLARQAQAHAECLLKLANGITPTPPTRERKPKVTPTTPQPVGDDGLTPAQRAWKTRREKWAASGDPRAKAAA